MNGVIPPPAASLPLESLYEQYRPALHALARRWSKDPDRCDDLVQESLLLGWKRKVDFADPRAFLAWSRETLRYLALAENRANHRPQEPRSTPDTGDDAEEVLHCAERVARMNPGERSTILAAFILHTVFRFGLRYLSYVLEAPKSTVARKFDAIRKRLAAGRWEQKPLPAEEEAASRVLEDVGTGLVREKLMAAETRSAAEICAFPIDLLWKGIARFPAAQTRLLSGIVMNISYAFRRCRVDSRLDAERTRIRRMVEVLPTDDPRTEAGRVGADYMFLRSTPGVGREAWQTLLTRMEGIPTWGGMVSAIEHACGWEQARNYLSTRFRRTEIDHSFYLSYLAAHYSMRRGEPRVAHRHLTRILEFYCPEYFRPHIDELRATCVGAWHQGGIEVPTTSRLLA